MGDCSPDRIATVDQLSSGENHVIYKVSYRGPEGNVNDVVVRLGSGDPAELLRAEREARVLSQVGGVAGPELYDFTRATPGVDGSAMCLQFVDGQQLGLADVGPERVERLGGLVQWLHAQPVENLSDWASADAGLSTYLEERWQDHLVSRLPAIRDPLPRSLQHRLNTAVAQVSAAREKLNTLLRRAPDERLVVLHADISGANLLWAPEPVLIDWEYARLGDPADEVAYLFTQNGLSSIQEQAFWRGYSTNLDQPRLSRIMERTSLWMPIALFGSVLWWLDAWSRSEGGQAPRPVYSPRTRPADYYLNHAVLLLDRFDQLQASQPPGAFP